MLNYNFNNSHQFLTPVKNHLRENAIVIREKLKEANLMKLWYQPVSAFYYMIDFSQTPVFKKYLQDKNDTTDYSYQICNDILDQLGVVIVPGTDFGMKNSARISLVLQVQAFSEAMDKLVGFLKQ
jgi:aspartate aminotransferase